MERRDVRDEQVALLAEGVDRNNLNLGSIADTGVALLAEGVDRNKRVLHGLRNVEASPSSQRAWIEIGQGLDLTVKINRRPPRRGRG